MKVTRASDLDAAKRSGKVGFIFCFQMASPFDWDLGKLETFVQGGVRQIQLADGRRNFIADTCWEPSNAGLSRFGFEVIEAFNRLGVVTDLSHVGERSALDAIFTPASPSSSRTPAASRSARTRATSATGTSVRWRSAAGVPRLQPERLVDDGSELTFSEPVELFDGLDNTCGHLTRWHLLRDARADRAASVDGGVGLVSRARAAGSKEQLNSTELNSTRLHAALAKELRNRLVAGHLMVGRDVVYDRRQRSDSEKRMVGHGHVVLSAFGGRQANMAPGLPGNRVTESRQSFR